MCKKAKHNRIDKCMRNLISNLKILGIKTLACCCGHGKYPMTIVVKWTNINNLEICHTLFVPREKKFYKKDKQGYYYIPEVSKEKK